MKWFKKVSIAISVAFAAFTGYAGILPGDDEVLRPVVVYGGYRVVASCRYLSFAVEIQGVERRIPIRAYAGHEVPARFLAAATFDRVGSQQR